MALWLLVWMAVFVAVGYVIRQFRMANGAAPVEVSDQASGVGRQASGTDVAVRVLQIAPIVILAAVIWTESRNRELDAGRGDIVVLWIIMMALAVVVAAWPVQAPSLARFLAWVRTYKLEIGAVTALTIGGLVARAYRLETYSWIYSGDEGSFGLAARDVLEGRMKNPFTTMIQAHPTFVSFLQAGVMRVVGDDVTGSRMLSALVGAATVPFLYLYVRRHFGVATALVACALLMVFHLHLFWSRDAQNNIWAPFFVVIVLWLLDRVIEWYRPVDAIIAGLTIGVAQLFYVSNRLLIVLAVLYLGYAFVAAWVAAGGWRLAAGGETEASGVGRQETNRRGVTIEHYPGGPGDRPGLETPGSVNESRYRADDEGINNETFTTGQPSGAFSQTVRRIVTSGLLIGAGIVLGMLPLAAYYFDYPDEYTKRIELVSIFDSGWLDREQEITGESAATIIWDNFKTAALVPFDTVPAPTFYHPPPPLVGWPLVLPIALGLILATVAFWKRKYFGLVAIYWMTVVGMSLTVGPDEVSRFVMAVSLLPVFAAIGLVEAARFVMRRARVPALFAGAVVAGVVAGAVVWNVNFYFHDTTPQSRHSDFNTRIADEFAWDLKELGPEWTVYYAAAPRMFYLGHPSLPFIAKGNIGIDVIEQWNPYAPPPQLSGPTVFFFLPERRAELATVEGWFPGGETIDHTLSDGTPLYTEYRVIPEGGAG